MNVFNLTLTSIDDEIITLKELIDQTTEQTILNHKYQLDQDDELISYTAWTEDYVLVLMNTPFGSYLLKTDRNYKEQ